MDKCWLSACRDFIGHWVWGEFGIKWIQIQIPDHFRLPDTMDAEDVNEYMRNLSALIDVGCYKPFEEWKNIIVDDHVALEGCKKLVSSEYRTLDELLKHVFIVGEAVPKQYKLSHDGLRNDGDLLRQMLEWSLMTVEKERNYEHLRDHPMHMRMITEHTRTYTHKSATLRNILTFDDFDGLNKDLLVLGWSDKGFQIAFRNDGCITKDAVLESLNTPFDEQHPAHLFYLEHEDDVVTVIRSRGTVDQRLMLSLMHRYILSVPRRAFWVNPHLRLLVVCGRIGWTGVTGKTKDHKMPIRAFLCNLSPTMNTEDMIQVMQRANGRSFMKELRLQNPDIDYPEYKIMLYTTSTLWKTFLEAQGLQCASSTAEKHEIADVLNSKSIGQNHAGKHVQMSVTRYNSINEQGRSAAKLPKKGPHRDKALENNLLGTSFTWVQRCALNESFRFASDFDLISITGGGSQTHSTQPRR